MEGDRTWSVVGPLIPIACRPDKSRLWCVKQQGQAWKPITKIRHKTQMLELDLNILGFVQCDIMLKAKMDVQSRVPGHCQQRGGLDDENFSIWHSRPEQTGVKFLANTDALGNNVHSGDGVKLPTWTNVFCAKLRERAQSPKSNQEIQ